VNPKSKGISRVVPIAIVIVILAVAGIAYYLVSTTTTTPTSPTSSTLSTSTSYTFSIPTSSTLVSSSLSSTTGATTSIASSTTTGLVPPSTTTESTTVSSPPSATSSTTGATTPSCLTTSLSNSTEEQELVGWFGNYSSLAISFKGTKNGQTENLNFSYTVAYKSPTTYKVDITIVYNGKSHTDTVWDLRNGTILALFTTKNYTGYSASNYVLGYFSDLETLYTLALQSTNTAYFHSTGTSTATIGTNPQFTVTNYVANTTPEAIQGCNNSGSGSVSNDSVNLGTPNGSNFELVVSSTFVGSLTDASGTTTTLDFTYQTTEFTVA